MIARTPPDAYDYINPPIRVTGVSTALNHAGNTAAKSARMYGAPPWMN